MRAISVALLERRRWLVGAALLLLPVLVGSAWVLRPAPTRSSALTAPASPAPNSVTSSFVSPDPTESSMPAAPVHPSPSQGHANPSTPRTGGPTEPRPAAPTIKALPEIDSLDFIGGNEGWASGGFVNADGIKKRAALIHTVDGGHSWSEIPVPAGYNNANAVHFANGNDGWLSLQGPSPDSDFGAATLVTTHNAGAIWTVVVGPVGKNAGFSLAPRAGVPLVAWGPDKASYDPDQTVPRMWVNPGGTGGFRAVRMPANVSRVQDASVVGGVIYAVVLLYKSGPSDPAAAFVRSPDWGVSWAQMGPVDQSAWRLNVFDDQSAVAFGYQNPQCCSAPSGMSGRMLATSDGGQTWHPLPLPGGVGCARGDFISAATARLACLHNGGLGDLMATDDGGAHWTSRPLPNTNWPRYCTVLFFLDPNHGWAADSASDGKHALSFTIDGGLHWQGGLLH